jgi:hypothetical protein
MEDFSLFAWGNPHHGILVNRTQPTISNAFILIATYAYTHIYIHYSFPKYMHLNNNMKSYWFGSSTSKSEVTQRKSRHTAGAASTNDPSHRLRIQLCDENENADDVHVSNLDGADATSAASTTMSATSALDM